MWLIFVFHQNRGAHLLRNKVRPPKVGDKKGLFATRTPHRPNPIGLTLCKLDGIVDGTTLLLSQHDLIDQTPVLDVKVLLLLHWFACGLMLWAAVLAVCRHRAQRPHAQLGAGAGRSAAPVPAAVVARRAAAAGPHSARVLRRRRRARPVPRHHCPAAGAQPALAGLEAGLRGLLLHPVRALACTPHTPARSPAARSYDRVTLHFTFAVDGASATVDRVAETQMDAAK